MSRRGKKSAASTLAVVLGVLIFLGIAVVGGAYFLFSTQDETTVGKVEDAFTEDVDDSDVSDSDSNKKEDKDNTPKAGKSIQDEVAEIEAKAKEHDDSFNSENASQTDMNNFEVDAFNIWDNELNSLWDRLTEEVDASKKDELVKEQKAWNAEKEANSKVAGLYALGGTMQAMLEAGEMEEMTHERVYVLAGYLAEARGESFSVPAEVQKIFDNRKTLDQTFEALSGEWMFDEKRGAVIGVQRSSECEYGIPDSNWTVWITGGDIMSDLEVYGYCGSSETIVFKKGSEYYKLEKAFDDENTLILSYVSSLDEECTDPIYGTKVQ